MAAPNQPCRHCPHSEYGHELAGPCMARGCPCQRFAAQDDRAREAPLFEAQQALIGEQG